MRLFRKNNGAVSVFLVIILVPVLVVTSLFVDVARMHLGQAVVDSAGDLALNTAMTQFDSELNEYYGLLGTCKNKDELKTLSKDFYEKALGSAGLTKEQSKNMAKEMIGWFDKDPENVSDLMNIKSVQDSFDLSTIDNSGFNNPAIVKTQIVNFMKYRSPINGTLNMLKALQEIKEKTDNSKEDAKLISEKTEMCEAENDLLEQLNQMYHYMCDYEQQSAGEQMKVSDPNGMQEIIIALNNNKKDFSELAKSAAVNFLYLDSEVKNFNPKDKKYDIKIPQAKKGKTIKSVIKELTDNFKEYDEVKEKLDSAIDINSGNAVRDAIIKASKVPELYEEYSKLLNEMLVWYTTLDDFSDAQKNSQPEYPTICAEYEKRYNAADPLGEKKASSPTSYWKVHEGKVKGVGDKSAKELYDRERTKLNSRIEVQCKKIQNISGALGNSVNDIEGAIDVINGILRDNLLQKFKEKHNTWSDHIDSLKAQGKETEIVQADDKMRDGSDRTNNMDGFLIAQLMKLTDSDLGNLRSHLVALKSHLSSINSKIKQTKFGNKKIVDIKSDSSNDFVEIINKQWETKITEEEFENSFNDVSGLQNIVDSRFGDLYEDHIGTQSSDWITNANQSPDVTNEKGYKICEEIFRIFSEDEDGKKEANKKYKNYKKKLDELENKDDSKNLNDDNLPSEYLPAKVKLEKGKIITEEGKEVEGSELPSQNDSSHEVALKDGKKAKDFTKAADTMTSFFGGLANQLTMMATGLRDDLYSVDYIMSMLSYDTYVNEGLYNTAKSMNKDVKDLEKTASAIRQKEVIDTWTDEALTNTDNKTLTNKVISQKNNFAFGGEGEYILYGKSDISKNKEKSYGTIFALRYAFNAVYGFKEYWSNATLNGIAAEISAATYGILPPALIKIAVILAIVMAESIYDIACLKVGMPVVIIKSKSTWHTKFGEVFDTDDKLKEIDGSSSDSGSITDVALQYSDYLKIFLMVSMISGNENKIYLRTADVIQCNMSKITGKAYDLSTVKTWFTVSSKIEVTPLLLDMPWTRDVEGNPKDNAAWYTLNYSRSNGYY